MNNDTQAYQVYDDKDHPIQYTNNIETIKTNQQKDYDFSLLQADDGAVSYCSEKRLTTMEFKRKAKASTIFQKVVLVMLGLCMFVFTVTAFIEYGEFDNTIMMVNMCISIFLLALIFLVLAFDLCIFARRARFNNYHSIVSGMIYFVIFGCTVIMVMNTFLIVYHEFDFVENFNLLSYGQQIILLVGIVSGICIWFFGIMSMISYWHEDRYMTVTNNVK